MGIGVALLAEGKAGRPCAVIPEYAFNPKDIFEALKKRDVHIHENLEMIEDFD